MASDERKVRDSFLQERDFGMYSLCAISLSCSGSWRGPDDVSSAYAIGRSIRICHPLRATCSRTRNLWVYT